MSSKELFISEPVGIMRYVWIKGENGHARNFLIRSADTDQFISIMKDLGVKAMVYEQTKELDNV